MSKPWVVHKISIFNVNQLFFLTLFQREKSDLFVGLGQDSVIYFWQPTHRIQFINPTRPIGHFEMFL